MSSFFAAYVPAASAAPVQAVPAFVTSSALAAPAATGALRALAADATACDRVSPAEVADDALRLRGLRAARLAQTVSIPAPHLDSNAFRAFVLRTYPKQAVTTIPTAHAMTAREYATFRAVGLVRTGRMNATQAVHACHSQAAAVMHARPNWQCGLNGCLPPIQIVAHDTGGGAGRISSKNGAPSGASTTTSSGATIGTGAVSAVTLSGVWIANPNGSGNVYLPGPIPSMQTVRNETYSGKPFSYTFVEPDPGWVPQTGWVVVPGTTFWAYINNTNKYLVLEFDGSGNDYVEVFETANGGFQMYLHAVNAAGQVVSQYTPIALSGSGNAQDLRRLAIHPDVSPGEAVLGLGGLLAAVGIGLVALAPIAGLFGASAAAAGVALILDGAALVWTSQYITDGTVSEDWSMDDGYADFGEGGDGFSDPGIDEDIF